jgi:hypothetical protein
MTVLLTLTTAGADSGPFDLYTNLDGYTNPFETGVLKSALVSGYSSTVVPDYTSIVRIKSNGDCINYTDIVLINTTTTTSTSTSTTTTTTTAAVINCNETAQSGGVGVTEYSIIMDQPSGGVIAIQFNAQGVPDKLEIIHNNIKVATSGMTIPNSGPFDNVYGDPTVPTVSETNTVDQFIGTSKGTIPTRSSEFLSETGMTNTLTKQQWVWFAYSSADYSASNLVTLRITGPDGTAWDLVRSCESTTTTTTTVASVCRVYRFQNGGSADATYSYTICGGGFVSTFMGGFETVDVCAEPGSANSESIISITDIGPC